MSILQYDSNVRTRLNPLDVQNKTLDRTIRFKKKTWLAQRKLKVVLVLESTTIPNLGSSCRQRIERVNLFLKPVIVQKANPRRIKH